MRLTNKQRYFSRVVEWIDILPFRNNQRVRKAREFWKRFLIQEPTNYRDWETARSYAGEWSLCACGSTLPRELREGNTINGEPEDIDLYNLGMDFADAVVDKDYPRSRRIFLDIQRREAELLQNIDNPTYN